MLLAVVVGIALVGTGAYHWRRSVLDAEASAARQEGLTAFAAGDMAAARAGLAHYLERHGDAAESAACWHVYGKALVAGPVDGNRAIGAQRRALLLDPGLIDARRELMTLHASRGHLSEALEHARQILAVRPDDETALRTRVRLLAAARRTQEALAAAEQLQRFAPADLDDHLRTFALLRAAGRDADEVLAWARARASAEGGSLVLLETAALALAGREEDLAAALTRAAATEGLDEPALRLLVRQFESVSRYDEALGVLEREGAVGPSSPLRLELARRYWYRNRAADLERRFGAAVDADPSADPELTGWVALARIAQRRADAAQTQLAALRDAAARSPSAATWSVFLERVVLPGSSSPAERRQACLDALERSPEEALLIAALGDAHLAAGDPDLAVVEWTRAADRAPGWALPLHRAAETLLAQGRAGGAADLAYRAARSDPRDAAALAAWVAARSASLEDLGLAEVEELAAAIADLRRRLPAEPRALLAQIRLMARSDRDTAAGRVRAALTGYGALDERAYLALAALSEELRLGTQRECLEEARSVLGPSPALALSLALSGPREQATDTFDRDRAAAAGSGRPDAGWALAYARLLERLGDSEAGPAWVKAADVHPADLTVQMEALHCRAVWTDLAAVDRLLERVRELAGAEGVAWTVLRARRLLAGPRGREGAADAVALLRAAVERAPWAVEAHLVLAQALQAAGREAEARDVALRTFSRFPDDERPARAAAALFAADARWEETLSMSRAWQSHGVSRDGGADLLAAHALVALGRPAEAAEALEPHVAATDGESPAALPFLAQYLAASLRAGHAGDALAVAARLARTDPAWRARLLSMDVRPVPTEAAIAWLPGVERLCEPATPGEFIALARAWRDLAVRTDRVDCRERAAFWVGRVLEDPAAGAMDLFTAGALFEELGDPRTARAGYDRALALDPDLSAAHNNLAMVELSGGAVTRAAVHARRACELDPDQPEFQDTLGLVQRAAGDLAGAVAAYRRARSLDGADPRFPIALAEVLLEAGDEAEASRTLESWAGERDRPAGLTPALRARYNALLGRLSRQARPR